MRLITHNMLRCNAKGVENGYPLMIEAERVEVIAHEYDAEVVAGLLRKVNFAALKGAAANLSLSEGIESVEAPLSEEALQDEAFLRGAHKLLFEVHVIEGTLVCPASGRRFPVRDGIPNMLLHEDEV
jgi:multifunctional methyltransferase subunit TRM112